MGRKAPPQGRVRPIRAMPARQRVGFWRRRKTRGGFTQEPATAFSPRHPLPTGSRIWQSSKTATLIEKNVASALASFRSRPEGQDDMDSFEIGDDLVGPEFMAPPAAPDARAAA